MFEFQFKSRKLGVQKCKNSSLSNDMLGFQPKNRNAGIPAFKTTKYFLHSIFLESYMYVQVMFFSIEDFYVYFSDAFLMEDFYVYFGDAFLIEDFYVYFNDAFLIEDFLCIFQ